MIRPGAPVIWIKTHGPFHFGREYITDAVEDGGRRISVTSAKGRAPTGFFCIDHFYAVEALQTARESA